MEEKKKQQEIRIHINLMSIIHTYHRYKFEFYLMYYTQPEIYASVNRATYSAFSFAQCTYI